MEIKSKFIEYQVRLDELDRITSDPFNFLDSNVQVAKNEINNYQSYNIVDFSTYELAIKNINDFQNHARKLYKTNENYRQTAKLFRELLKIMIKSLEKKTFFHEYSLCDSLVSLNKVIRDLKADILVHTAIEIHYHGRKIEVLFKEDKFEKQFISIKVFKNIIFFS